ncbi:MAG: hypothetical protein JO171_01990, partial [Paludibacterium sp.]
MFLFNCTQNAANQLHRRQNSQTKTWITAPPEALTARAWRWQLHAATIRRKRVFVAMEHKTHFALLLWDIKRGDGAAVFKQMLEHIGNQARLLSAWLEILSVPATETALTHMMDAHRQFAFVVGDIDRSVQSHINDVIQQVESLAAHYGLPQNIQATMAWEWTVNDNLCSQRGGEYFYPNEAW